MSRQEVRRTAPKRREIIKYGSALAAGGLLAGCTGNEDDAGGPESDGEATETDTETATDTVDESGDSSYAVTMSPAGTVEFEAVPEDVFTVFPWYADMAIALGHGDSINSLWWAAGFDPIIQYYTAGLEDVSVSWAELSGVYGANKEQLYELDSDLHLADPAWFSTLDDWNQDDIDEIADNVGPWLGNQYSNRHLSPPEGWADDYEYYTIWEVFERVADVYSEQARYEALEAVHTEQLATIEDGLPPADERPTVGYLQIATDLSSIFVFRLNDPGYYNSHTRPMEATDAFADVSLAGEFAEIDFEALLDADPDTLLTLWGMTPTVDFETMRTNLEDHALGGELSAVQNDRVYTQGTRFQGPIMNFFQLEMTAKQLYPEQFGQWPGYVDGESYPEFPEDEQLFDRQRVADIINGNL